MERTDRVDQIMETSSDLPGETASVIRERADAGFVDRVAKRGQIARLLEAAGQGLSAAARSCGRAGTAGWPKRNIGSAAVVLAA